MMKSPEELKEQVSRAVDGADTVVLFAATPDGKLRMVLHGDPVAIVNILSREAPRAVAKVFAQVSEPGVNLEDEDDAKPA